MALSHITGDRTATSDTARTVAPAVGVTLEDAEDLERRRRHVVGLVLNGVAGLERPLSSTLTRSPGND